MVSRDEVPDNDRVVSAEQSNPEAGQRRSTLVGWWTREGVVADPVVADEPVGRGPGLAGVDEEDPDAVRVHLVVPDEAVRGIAEEHSDASLATIAIRLVAGHDRLCLRRIA